MRDSLKVILFVVAFVAGWLLSEWAISGVMPVEPVFPGIKAPAIKKAERPKPAPKSDNWILITTKLYRLAPGFPAPESMSIPVEVIREYDPEEVIITDHPSRQACLEAATETLYLNGDYAQVECVPKGE